MLRDRAHLPLLCRVGLECTFVAAGPPATAAAAAGGRRRRRRRGRRLPSVVIFVDPPPGPRQNSIFALSPSPLPPRPPSSTLDYSKESRSHLILREKNEEAAKRFWLALNDVAARHLTPRHISCVKKSLWLSVIRKESRRNDIGERKEEKEENVTSLKLLPKFLSAN